jgi:SAM-dependent methyltransferase
MLMGRSRSPQALQPIKALNTEINPVVSHGSFQSALRHPFGYEYAESSRWSPFERLYIRLFGQIDLPTRMRARLIRKVLQALSWKTLLDFGCGTGSYSFYFSRSPEARVCGIDIRNNQISDCMAIARKLKRKSLDFVCSSSIFETDHFQPNSIDVVLAVEVLQYLPDVQAGFREIQRVLKPGGYLIANFPLLGYKRRLETIVFDTQIITRFLEESGFELISITRIFGRTADALCRIFGLCYPYKPLAALVFPLLLAASIPFGGADKNGNHCMAVARKK